MLAALTNKQFQSMPSGDRSYERIVAHFRASPFAESAEDSQSVTARSTTYKQERLGKFQVDETVVEKVSIYLLANFADHARPHFLKTADSPEHSGRILYRRTSGERRSNRRPGFDNTA